MYAATAESHSIDGQDYESTPSGALDGCWFRLNGAARGATRATRGGVPSQDELNARATIAARHQVVRTSAENAWTVGGANVPTIASRSSLRPPHGGATTAAC
jgi:hypothetical protein